MFRFPKAADYRDNPGFSAFLPLWLIVAKCEEFEDG
jgi:hypothetical protein